MSATADAAHAEQHVKIAYNGDSKKFPFDKRETVASLLKQALEKFGVVNSPHLFGLFTLEMVELADDQTLHEAKVHPDQKLILRQSEVRGG